MSGVLVLGYSGQVASQLRELLPDALFWGRATLDISDTRALERAIIEAAPTAVVNAAAYTAVDRAEEQAAEAWRINAEAPAAAARAAEALGIPLVQLSTDYVFDGESESGEPYAPEARTRPLSVYGRTKLGGELAVASLCSRHWILRTSWVFSATGNNFVRTMLRLAASHEVVRVVNDQLGRPTYAGHLAEAIAGLAGVAGHTPLPWGTYHAVGGPVVSWCQFARRIFDRAAALGLLERPPRLEPIATKDYPTAAVRPLKAVLAPSPELAGARHGGFEWPAGLDEALREIRREGSSRNST